MSFNLLYPLDFTAWKESKGEREKEGRENETGKKNGRTKRG